MPALSGHLQGADGRCTAVETRTGSTLHGALIAPPEALSGGGGLAGLPAGRPGALQATRDAMMGRTSAVERRSPPDRPAEGPLSGLWRRCRPLWTPPLSAGRG